MEKKGIELLVDRIEVLRVRIDRYRIEQYQRNALSEVNYDHWLQLCREALFVANLWQNALETITANLALPKDADHETVAQAVKICVRRVEELEARLAPLDPAVEATAKRADDLLPGLGRLVRNGTLVDGNVERKDDSMWAPTKSPTGHDMEQRVDSIEDAMLSAWLDDAQRRLRASAVYMVSHEGRFSEDMFDEMRLLADKIEEWASSIRKGDRFP